MNAASSGASSLGARRWHNAAWDYYDVVPEAGTYADFVGLCFSRVVLRPGWLGDDDKPGPLLDENGMLREDLVGKVPDDLVATAVELVRALRTVPGGQPVLMEGIGQNFAHAGDLYIVGTDVTDDKGQVLARSFECLSTEELVPVEGIKPGDPPRYKRRPSGSATAEKELPEGSFVLRIWRPHPRYRAWPNSAVRRALPTLEAMRLLTLESLAQVRSRLFGRGILWVDDSIDLPPVPDHPDAQPLQQRLIDVASVAIQDPGSASATVPLVVPAPTEAVRHGIRWDNFDMGDLRVEERRSAKVDDFARAVPMPPETITGHGDTTFANAFAIGEATFGIYIAAPLGMVTGYLTHGYYQPQLAEAAGNGPDRKAMVGRMVIWPDSSELVTHPDRAKAAAAAVGTERNPSFVISESASRQYQGFREADKPDDEEIARRMERAKSLGSAGSSTPAGDNPDAPGPRPPTLPETPDPNAAASLAVRLASAADYAADRAVESLSGRLRAKVRTAGSMTTEERAELLEMNGQLVRHLGRERIAKLMGPDLFPGEFDPFEATARRFAAEAGHPNPRSVARTCRALAKALATERLFDPSVKVKPAAVAKALEGK